jgi:hypothetical protein
MMRGALRCGHARQASVTATDRTLVRRQCPIGPLNEQEPARESSNSARLPATSAWGIIEAPATC